MFEIKTGARLGCKGIIFIVVAHLIPFILLLLTFPPYVCPQSRHQQRPLLRDAGCQEEEGVVHEEALKLLSTPNVALDSRGGLGVSARPVWASAEATVEVCLRPLQGISLGYILALALGLCRPGKQEACWGF